MILVGVHGRIGTGKDTVAAYLCRQWGFSRRGFADALKREVATRLRTTLITYLVEADEATRAECHQFEGTAELEVFWEQRLREALWVEKPPVLRALLQEYGTEVRRADDADYWVRAWVETLPGDRSSEGLRSWPRITVPDVRFTNEAATLRRLGGHLVKVVRSGRRGDAHASETDLDGWTDWDLVLVNDASVPALEAKVAAWIAPLVRAAHGAAAAESPR
jgi:hypothetical protein